MRLIFGSLDTSPILIPPDMSEEELTLTGSIALLAAIRRDNATASELQEMQNFLEHNQMPIQDLFRDDNRAIAVPYLQKWTCGAITLETMPYLESGLKLTVQHLKLLTAFVPKNIRAPFHVMRPRRSMTARAPELFRRGGSRKRDQDIADYEELVEGDHYTMLKEPHAKALAGTIAAFLGNQGNIRQSVRHHGVSPHCLDDGLKLQSDSVVT